MKKYIIIFTLSLSYCLNAQGIFLNNGESGFTFNFKISWLNYLGTNIGYSYKSLIDIGLEYGTKSYSDEDETKVFSPYISFQPCKIIKNCPFSILLQTIIC